MRRRWGFEEKDAGRVSRFGFVAGVLVVPPQSWVLFPGQGLLQRARSVVALVSGSRSSAQKHSLGGNVLVRERFFI